MDPSRRSWNLLSGRWGGPWVGMAAMALGVMVLTGLGWTFRVSAAPSVDAPARWAMLTSYERPREGGRLAPDPAPSPAESSTGSTPAAAAQSSWMGAAGRSGIWVVAAFLLSLFVTLVVERVYARRMGETSPPLGGERHGAPSFPPPSG